MFSYILARAKSAPIRFKYANELGSYILAQFVALLWRSLWRCFGAVCSAVLAQFVALFWRSLWRCFGAVCGAVLVQFVALFWRSL